MKMTAYASCILGIIIAGIVSPFSGIIGQAIGLQSELSDDSNVETGSPKSSHHDDISSYTLHTESRIYSINDDRYQRHTVNNKTCESNVTRHIYDNTPNLSSILGRFNIRGRATISRESVPQRYNKSSILQDAGDYDFLVPPPQMTLHRAFHTFKPMNGNTMTFAQWMADPKREVTTVQPVYSLDATSTSNFPGNVSRNQLQGIHRLRTNSGISQNPVSHSSNHRSNTTLLYKMHRPQNRIPAANTTNFINSFRTEAHLTIYDKNNTSAIGHMYDSKSGGNYSESNVETDTNVHVESLSPVHEIQTTNTTIPPLTSALDDYQLLIPTFHNNNSEENTSLNVSRVTSTIIDYNAPEDMVEGSSSQNSTSNRNESAIGSNGAQNNRTGNIERSVSHNISPCSGSSSRTPANVSLTYFNVQQEALRKQLIEHDRLIFSSQKRLEHNSKNSNSKRTDTSQDSKDLKLDEEENSVNFNKKLKNWNLSTVSSDTQTFLSPINVSTRMTESWDNKNSNSSMQFTSAEVNDNHQSYRPKHNQTRKNNTITQHNPEIIDETLSAELLSMNKQSLTEMTHEEKTNSTVNTMETSRRELGSDHAPMFEYHDISNQTKKVNSTSTIPRIPIGKLMNPLQYIRNIGNRGISNESSNVMTINDKNDENIYESVHKSCKRGSCKPREITGYDRIEIPNTLHQRYTPGVPNQPIHMKQDSQIRKSYGIIPTNHSRSNAIGFNTEENTFHVTISPLENLFNLSTEMSRDNQTISGKRITLDSDWKAIFEYNKTSVNDTSAMANSVTNRPKLMTLKNTIRPRFSIKHYRNQMKQRDHSKGYVLLSNYSSHAITQSRMNKSSILRNAGSLGKINISNYTLRGKTRSNNMKLPNTPFLNITRNDTDYIIRKKASNKLQNNMQVNSNRLHSEISNKTAEVLRKNHVNITNMNRESMLRQARPHSSIGLPRVSGKYKERMKKLNVVASRKITSKLENSSSSEPLSVISRYDPDEKSAKLLSDKNYSIDTSWSHARLDALEQTKINTIDSIRNFHNIQLYQLNSSNIVSNRTQQVFESQQHSDIIDMKDSPIVVSKDSERDHIRLPTNFNDFANVTSIFPHHTRMSKSELKVVMPRSNSARSQIAGQSEQPALPIEEFFREILRME